MLPLARFALVVFAAGLFGLAMEYAHFVLAPLYWLYRLWQWARNW